MQNKLPPGRHRFALVVVDEHGRESAPDICEVTVQPRQPGQHREQDTKP
nr:hypothetical protein [uncultured Roseateles sp.]